MERKCSIEGCEKAFKGRDLCEMHLLRLRKYGDPSVVRVKQPKPLEQRPRCVIEDCDKLAVGGGLCRNHYMRKRRRGGDPAVTLPRGRLSTSMASRTHMFEMGDPDECWEWKGYRSPKGYGRVGKTGQVKYAHRAVYEELVGPVPDDLTVDHLCGNRGCVNPHHMDLCSLAENVKRGGYPHFERRGSPLRK